MSNQRVLTAVASMAQRHPLGGPDRVAAQVLLIVFAIALVADRLAGGPSPRRTAAADRGTFWLIQAGQGLALLGTLAAPRWAGFADFPSVVWPIGAVIIGAGAVLRVWSLRALGAQFRRDVQVRDEDHLVTSGPYRVLRHPSYAAVLLLFTGLGLGQANAVSLAISLIVPALVYMRRIRVEEAAMEAAYGEAFRAFAATRRRLIPGIY